MSGSKRFSSSFGALACAFMFGGMLAGGSASANENALRPPASVPVTKSASASGNTTELPPSALGYDDGKSHAEAWEDDKSDVKIPNKWQLGPNTLHFDAENRNYYPPGIDANEDAVTNKAAPSDSPLPSYFGLRLTAPMH